MNVDGPSSGTGEPPATVAAQIERYAAYHRDLFGALYRWDDLWKHALELTGDPQHAIALALDQVAHFGPRGVTLVMDRLVATTHGPLEWIVELGSGFGGAVRHAGRELRSRGVRARLIGVEIVPEHCALAAAIGRALGDEEPLILQADASRLPFRADSVDALFAVGVLFSSMADVTAECRRVLRPGGVVVMTDEVNVRLRDALAISEAFLRHHPLAHAASPEERRAEFETAGLTVEVFESLADWAAPLLRQRVQMLRFLRDCAVRMFGADECRKIVETLASAADEYERGSLQPVLVVARRA